MNARARRPLRPWWRALGWLLLAALTAGSLLPMPGAMLPVAGGDKFGHVLGWALVAGSWLQLADRDRVRWRVGIGLLLWSAAIELAQALTPWRSGDWIDLAANALGIALAGLLDRTLARDLLTGFERARSARRVR